MSYHKQYDMEEQDKIEESMIPSTMLFLKRKYGNEPLNIRHLHTEVDFNCGIYTFDLKADTRVSETNNVFVETASVVQNGNILKKGWLFNSTNYILYADTKNMRLLSIKLKQLREHVDLIKNFPFREIDQKKGYITQGYLIPVPAILFWLGIDWEILPQIS